MFKNYQKWMPIKTHINNNSVRPTYKEGYIYWMSLGENVGCEQDGKGEVFTRPVLIIKGFSRELFWGIPLSSQIKKGPYYYIFNFSEKTKSCAILSQLKALDSARIYGKSIGKINNKVLSKIRKRLQLMLESQFSPKRSQPSRDL